MGGAFLLSVVLVLPGWTKDQPEPTPDGSMSSSPVLLVSVSDTPDAVQLRVQVLGSIEPGSLEVQFEGREALVLARDPQGRQIRSQAVKLPADVVEEGASAGYDADDALIMTLRKQTPARAAAPPGQPGAPGR